LMHKGTNMNILRREVRKLIVERVRFRYSPSTAEELAYNSRILHLLDCVDHLETRECPVLSSIADRCQHQHPTGWSYYVESNSASSPVVSSESIQPILHPAFGWHGTSYRHGKYLLDTIIQVMAKTCTVQFPSPLGHDRHPIPNIRGTKLLLLSSDHVSNSGGGV
jgi:hypothetical protein